MDDTKQIQILLIEDHPGDARLMRELLAEVKSPAFELEWVERLSLGMKRLAEGGIDVVLLDLALPDSQGLETFIRLHSEAPEVPIVALTGLNDEAFAVEAVQKGAQDYLVKGQVDSNVLARSLRYAIGRHRMQEELRALSLIDELTGLYNRRGFLLLSLQQLKSSHRTNQPVLLLIADVDSLKSINDTWGHQEGDLALIEIAKVLKETLREMDIIARLGGDEFVALLIGTREADAQATATRLKEKLKARNAQGGCRYTLSASVGITCYDPGHPCSIEDLIARADVLMYEQKRGAS